MTGQSKIFQRAWIAAAAVKLFLGVQIRAEDILEAVAGGVSRTSWNQDSQWAGGAVPVAGNDYVLYTNTANNSTLSSYYGVSFGTGYIRTPAYANASIFSGDSIIVPPGTEILLKETSGGSVSANIIFTNYNNITAAGLYPLIRLAPSTSGGTVTLSGRINNLMDSYMANDAGAAACAAYGTNLSRLINDVRLTYAINQPYGTNLPFFLSRISDNQTVYSLPSDSSYANYLLLRAGQRFATTNLSNVFLINTDPSQFSTATSWSSPGLHFDTQGQQALGMAFGRAVIQALPLPELRVPQKIGDHWLLNFTGISGTLQAVEYSPNVMGPWFSLTNILVGASSATNWITPDPPFPTSFYRVSRP